MTLGCKDRVELSPVVSGASDGSRVELAQQSREVGGPYPVREMVGPGEVRVAFDGDPLSP